MFVSFFVIVNFRYDLCFLEFFLSFSFFQHLRLSFAVFTNMEISTIFLCFLLYNLYLHFIVNV